ncbi:MAG: cold-shock protein [bacterium]|jgi:CspA family cold shock protein|nr:cold-shock protein [bacterium]
MATGKVKWFSETKGFGFIEQDGGGEFFVHHTGISGSGFKNLYEGQRVQFDTEPGPKGPKAVNVNKLD